MSIIKEIRESLGMNQRQFAEALGAKRPSLISNYESRFRTPDIKIAYKILDLAAQHGKFYRLEDIYPRLDNSC